MTAASVSIALCTFNGQRYLGEQLASLSRQTRLPDELVVCDDASTDGTIALVESFAKHARFPVRTHVHLQNVGSTKNFESAIRLCRGEIIVLADQDDVWKECKIERVAGFLGDHPAKGYVFSDAAMVGANLESLGYTLWKAIDFSARDRRRLRHASLFFQLLRRNVVTGATMAFRSTFCPVVLPMPESWVHDAWIALIISAVADGGFITEPLIEYRQHASQQIGDKLRTLYQQYQIAQAMRLEVHEKVAKNFAEAQARLSSLNGVSSEKLQALDQKVAHCRERCAMRRGRHWRLPAVLKELVMGRYSRYSLGWKSLCQDLFLQ